jgi:hypothetical protein
LKLARAVARAHVYFLKKGSTDWICFTSVEMDLRLSWSLFYENQTVSWVILVERIERFF